MQSSRTVTLLQVITELLPILIFKFVRSISLKVFYSFSNITLPLLRIFGEHPSVSPILLFSYIIVSYRQCPWKQRTHKIKTLIWQQFSYITSKLGSCICWGKNFSQQHFEDILFFVCQKFNIFHAYFLGKIKVRPVYRMLNWPENAIHVVKQYFLKLYKWNICKNQRIQEWHIYIQKESSRFDTLAKFQSILFLSSPEPKDELFWSLFLCRPSIHTFEQLLFWTPWANFFQISPWAFCWWGLKICTSGLSPLTKMATMPIYGKNT